jgi:hypothetical protein
MRGLKHLSSATFQELLQGNAKVKKKAAEVLDHPIIY